MNLPTYQRRLALLLILIGGLFHWLSQPPAATQPRLVRLAHRAVRWPGQWWAGRQAVAARRLSIQLDSVAWRTLTAARAEAIRRGLLPNEAKKWVPATIGVDGRAAQPAKIRLKGDYPDHWAGPKWSFRVQLPPTAPPAWGMRVFSIQDPATREFLAEWLLHRLLREEGSLAIRYEFGAVALNGADKGIFAIEESFGPELLTSFGRSGLLLKFDETALIDPTKRPEGATDEAAILRAAPIEAFDEKRVLADSALAPQFRRARLLLDGVRGGHITLDSAFDAEAAGRLYAICDLLGAHHATRWKNSRFAYDPATRRLTLIAYDGNAGGRIRHPYPAAFLPQYANDDPPFWKRRFFQSRAFQAAYRAQAARLSNPGFLEDFLRRAEPELTANRALMYRDRPTYDFEWLRDNLAANRAVLRAYAKRTREGGGG